MEHTEMGMQGPEAGGRRSPIDASDLLVVCGTLTAAAGAFLAFGIHGPLVTLGLVVVVIGLLRALKQAM